jgi:arsenate reductase
MVASSLAFVSRKTVEFMMRPNVLVLCTGNSCRSQIAEALWRRYGNGEWRVQSAGSNPAGYVHPLAIRAMEEWGIDLTAAHSKHLDEFPPNSMDLVITVCANAQQKCPVYPTHVEQLHWPFDDPADATGDDEQRMESFRRVRGEIDAKIRTYLNITS